MFFVRHIANLTPLARLSSRHDNAGNACHHSPLDGAVTPQNLEMLKFLLAHGAKPRGRELPNAAFYDNPQTAMNFVKVLFSPYKLASILLNQVHLRSQQAIREHL